MFTNENNGIKLKISNKNNKKLLRSNMEQNEN